jgi:outer membrane murein-binding lipoprotein Lpp
MKIFAVILLVILVSACSFNSKVIHADSNTVTVDHNFDMFADGMSTASKQCSEMNKNIKHESTSCQAGYHRCISTFVCTPK